MPKRIYTIELEQPLVEEEISEIIVISSRGLFYKANILPNVNCGLDGSSYEICLSNYVKNMKELENLWSPKFYQQNFMEYIEHFPNITLDLSFNHLSDEYLHNILRALSDECLDLLRIKLVKMNIEQNKITRNGFSELFLFVNVCPNFKELEASINLLRQKDYFDLKESGEIPKNIRDSFFYSNFYKN